MNLSRLAVARPIGTLIIFSAVVLVGLSALAGLPIDLLPDISFARLTISTSYSRAGPPAAARRGGPARHLQVRPLPISDHAAGPRRPGCAKRGGAPPARG